MTSPTPDFFRLDRDRAAADLRGSEDELWPVNAYSDADELNQLLDALQNADVLTANRSGVRLYIYPSSISEPEPLLAASSVAGPTLLGHELKLRERDGEDPVEFTLRLLEEIVAEANALLATARADGETLDRIAAYLNRPGQWNGGDVCELLATELLAGGRRVVCED
jgi:hypothetical protein